MQAIRFLARAGAVGLVAGFATTGLAAEQATAQEECAAAVREADQAMDAARIEGVTEEKAQSLLEDARELCEQGNYENAKTKLVNIHELLESEASE